MYINKILSQNKYRLWFGAIALAMGLVVMTLVVSQYQNLFDVEELVPAEEQPSQVFYEWSIAGPDGDICKEHSGAPGFIHGGFMPAGWGPVTSHLAGRIDNFDDRRLIAHPVFEFDQPEVVVDSATEDEKKEIEEEETASVDTDNQAEQYKKSSISEDEDEAKTDTDKDAPTQNDEVDESQKAGESSTVQAKDDAPDDDENDDGDAEQETADVFAPTDEFESSEDLSLPLDGEVIRDFGWIECQHINEWYFNPGLKISAKSGTEVVSSAAGTVVSIDEDARYGTTVTISHGELKSVYGSLKRVEVDEEEIVTDKQVIGTVGISSTKAAHLGPHLQWIVRDADDEPIKMQITENDRVKLER